MSGTKYGVIAHDLREAINRKEFIPGETLPPIPELMARYEVARDTVRDAIALLTHEGLVVPKRGIGTVVREVDPVALVYTEQAPAQTWQAQTQDAGKDLVVEAGWTTADPDIAHRLRVPVGSEIGHRVRHFYLGVGVAQISDQWFPAHIVQAIIAAGGGDLTDVDNRPDTERNVFQLMADAGHAPRQTTETITARMPDPNEREIMEAPPGMPVLITRRSTTEDDDRPVETTTAVGAGDRMSATLTVSLSY